MLKELLKCVGKYKLPSFLAPLFITGEVVLEVLIPLFMATIIDNGINAGNMNVVISTGATLVLLALLSLVCGALSGKYAAIASAGFAKNLRKKMFFKIQDYSFKNIDKFSTASLVTRMTTDVTNLQNSYQMIIRVAVRSPIMMVTSLIMAFSVNGRLSLIFFAILPVLGVGLYLIMTHAHPIFEKVFKIYDRLNTVVQENLRGIRVVKAYVREEHEKEKFKKASQGMFEGFSKADKLLAYNAPLMQFCVYSAMLLISWFGAHMIVQDAFTTGKLVTLISYVMQILHSLMMLSMIFVMITMSRASAERVVEVIKEVPDVKNPENPVFEVKSGEIEFDNVSFGYSENKNCLNNINLTIKSGQTIGILGETGSGKSSLVQLIPRLYDVTSGSIKVGGVDVRDYDLNALRDSVAVVLQKNVLFSGTIKENLRWGNKQATDEQIKNACRLAQADEFINTFPDKYDTFIEQGGSNVSGGQKQRLCIARALLKNPKILILDDSTSAVDTKTDAALRKAFKEAIPNTTKLIIAQRIASVMDADKIIVISGGKVSGFGTHDELIENNKIYKEVYYSQNRGGLNNGTDA
ncbi:MAG: ABC transporter ATP-binding protein [Clostridia bacterium]|nr:ABC transporter ATP-binding protein [Clostridia bacterium]